MRNTDSAFFLTGRVMKFRFVVFIVSCFGTVSVAQPLSLQDLVTFGLKNASGLRQQTLLHKNHELDLNIAKSAFWPSLQFTSKHGIADSKPQAKPKPHLSQFSVGLSQSLFNNFIDSHARDAAAFRVEKSAIDIKNQTSQLISNIHQAYFNFSRDQALLQSARKKHDLTAAQFKIIEKSYKSGFKPQTDFLRFKAQFQRSLIKIETLKHQVAVSRKSIATLIGQPPEGKLEVTPHQPDFKDLPQVTDLSVDYKNHYQVSASKLEENIVTEQAAIDRLKKWPQVTLNVEGSYGAEDYMGYDRSISETDLTTWTVYVGISFPLYDGGKSADQFEKSVNNKLSAIESTKNAQREVHEEGQNLLESIRLNIATAKLHLDLLKLEENNFSLLQKKYRQGQVNILELTTALENFELAKNNYIRTYFQLLTHKAKLWHFQRKFAGSRQTIL